MGRIEPSVVGFSGRISSGKTTVSKAVADSLQCSRASFGEFVASVARSRGLYDVSRLTMQQVGESLIADGWPQFCAGVLASAAWQPGSALVVDGIRHAEAIHHLTRIVTPLRFVHVHLPVEEEGRSQRIRQRHGGESGESQVEVEAHATEVEVTDVLPLIADLIVDGGRSLGDIVAEIVAFIDGPQ